MVCTQKYIERKEKINLVYVPDHCLTLSILWLWSLVSHIIRDVTINGYETEIGYKVKDTNTPLDKSKCTVKGSVAWF